MPIRLRANNNRVPERELPAPNDHSTKRRSEPADLDQCTAQRVAHSKLEGARAVQEKPRSSFSAGRADGQSYQELARLERQVALHRGGVAETDGRKDLKDCSVNSAGQG